jgi:hypothetical protein
LYLLLLLVVVVPLMYALCRELTVHAATAIRSCRHTLSCCCPTTGCRTLLLLLLLHRARAPALQPQHCCCWLDQALQANNT